MAREIAQPSPYQVVLRDAVQRIDGSWWGMDVGDIRVGDREWAQL